MTVRKPEREGLAEGTWFRGTEKTLSIGRAAWTERQHGEEQACLECV